jgi:hypothetical protein
MRTGLVNRLVSLLAIVLGAASRAPLRADFSFQEATQIAGGAAQKPITYLIKGNRVAALTKDHIRVIDVDREIVTDINLSMKTYSVKTFAQIKEGRGAANAEGRFKVAAKSTGQSKPVGVLNAEESVVTMIREGADSEILVDAWMATVPGFDDVKEFQRKLGQKLGYALGSPAGFEDMFEQVYKTLNKVVGVPIEFTARMGDVAAVSAAPPPAPPAATGVAGALGRLGGIAGLGRRKDTDQHTDQSAASPSSGGLVETSTQLTNFSAGPADATKFEVPAGFKKLE